MLGTCRIQVRCSKGMYYTYLMNIFYNPLPVKYFSQIRRTPSFHPTDKKHRRSFQGMLESRLVYDVHASGHRRNRCTKILQIPVVHDNQIKLVLVSEECGLMLGCDNKCVFKLLACNTEHALIKKPVILLNNGKNIPITQEDVRLQAYNRIALDMLLCKFFAGTHV